MVVVWVANITAVAEGTLVGVWLPCTYLPGASSTATNPAKEHGMVARITATNTLRNLERANGSDVMVKA